eukprot:CAMPEP_0179179718 /NCGR_PEP_ID=MMETSP0796-20121207/88948_1 /TAXON_ID=73915 /ORGANISM="Pyrodinium bahamense, Strain pbaha01" /LENGTH=157 /DNA_ID=CAMNT_0020883385 /DNA_START=1 /DNA_END=474 /DNA_ORIENTATION=+
MALPLPHAASGPLTPRLPQQRSLRPLPQQHAPTQHAGLPQGSLDRLASRLEEDRRRHFARAAAVQLAGLGTASAKLGEDKKRSEGYSASMQTDLLNLMNTMETTLANGVSTVVLDERSERSDSPGGGESGAAIAAKEAVFADEVLHRLLEEAKGTGD